MRLLVVENNPEMVELLRKELEEENHGVVLAREGAALGLAIGRWIARAHGDDLQGILRIAL